MHESRLQQLEKHVIEQVAMDEQCPRKTKATRDAFLRMELILNAVLAQRYEEVQTTDCQRE